MPSPAGSTVSTSSTLGYGTDLLYSTNGGSTYTSLGQVKNIQGPSTKVGVVDKTSLLSPNRTREKRPGLIDPQEVKFTMFFKAANKAVVMAMIASGETDYWKMAYPDGASTSSTDVFQAFVSDYEQKVELEESIEADVTLTVSGFPTFTQGS